MLLRPLLLLICVYFSHSTWLCSFALSISIGSVLLLPMSIISNEILVHYPDSYYVKWLNTSLITGLWVLLSVRHENSTAIRGLSYLSVCPLTLHRFMEPSFPRVQSLPVPPPPIRIFFHRVWGVSWLYEGKHYFYAGWLYIYQATAVWWRSSVSFHCTPTGYHVPGLWDGAAPVIAGCDGSWPGGPPILPPLQPWEGTYIDGCEKSSEYGWFIPVKRKWIKIFWNWMIHIWMPF